MEKFTNIAKGGWHPSGDKPIRKESWKSDIKGIATGKKKDPYEYARNHQSAPLSSLKDPDSFGPPPKHYLSGQPPSPSNALTPPKPQAAQTYQGPSGGLGSVVPSPRRREERDAEEAGKPKPPPVPYRTDTSGLRTDHLPKPPVRRGEGSSSPASTTTARAPLPASTTSMLPARGGPPPVLPPRQNEYPDEHTPAPPPSYTEAARQPANLINQAATSRLGQAGVSVPGFNIGSQSNTTTTPAIPTPTVAQVSELQQRFSRMNTGANSQGSSSYLASSSLASSAGSAILAAAAKKPPPPPPKKGTLAQQTTGVTDAAPPPLPLSSKPRPT